MKLSWTFILIVVGIVTWWIFRKQKTSVQLPAQESAPLANLENNIKSALAVVDNTLKVAINPDTHDPETNSLVDADPAAQNSCLQSDFITKLTSQSSKILMIDDDPLISSSMKEIQRDQMWWPKQAYQEAPEWLKPEFDLGKFEECSCGCGELLMKL
jgi:hypothetical protein